MRRLVLCAWLLFAAPVLAQPFEGSQRLLLTEGTVRGSPRLMGLAGAFVALADGAEGIPRNPAAAAMQHPSFDGDFHWDFAGTFHFLPPWATREQDWDNDGRADQASAGPFNFLGTQVIYAFGSLQYKSVALGLGLDVQNFLAVTRLEGDPIEYYDNVSLTHLYASLAGSFWRDQLLVGLGVESSHAFLGFAEQPPGNFLPNLPKDTMGFHGWGVQLGAVYRPENDDWRVGVSYKPQVTALPFVARETFGAGKVAPSAVAVPGRLSLGGAIALGRGRHLNITSPGGWVPRDDPPPPAVEGPQGAHASGKPGEPAPSKGPPPPPVLTSAMMKWLFTAQLDVFFPVQGATLVASFLEQPAIDAVPAGYQVSIQPRLGIEKELFMDLLRLRLGGYLEPPMTSGLPGGVRPTVRPHLTFGFELGLFKLGNERVSFGLSFDFASMYQNLSFGFLVWK